MTVTLKKKVTNGIELVRYHTYQKVRHGYNSAVRVAFVKSGPKWLKVVALDASADGGLRVWKVRADERQYMTPLLRKGKPYNIKRALRTFRSLAATHGITRGAKKLLAEVSAQHAQAGN